MTKHRDRILAATAIAAVFTAVWAFGPGEHEHAPQATHATGTDSVAAPRTVRSHTEASADVGEPERGYAAAKARIDAGLERLRERADRRDDDWLTLERIAAGHLERARLTGNWEDYGHAERALKRAFERAPEVGGPWLTQASLDYALHRFDRVERDLTQVERFEIVTWEQRRAVREMRAGIALQRGRYAEATKAYGELLDERRTRDALVGMAGYHWATGDLAQADELLDEAQDGASGSAATTRAWLCLTRGLVAMDDERLEDALAHYRRGLELVPGWWVLEEHEAEVLALTGKEELALERYRDIIERTGEPEMMDAAAGLLRQMGRDAEADRLRERAHELHERRIAKHPAAAFGHALGHFLEHEGDAARAVEIAEANTELRPNGPAYAQLAQAYLRADRIDQARHAVEHLRRSQFRPSAVREMERQLHATAAGAGPSSSHEHGHGAFHVH